MQSRPRYWRRGPAWGKRATLVEDVKVWFANSKQIYWAKREGSFFCFAALRASGGKMLLLAATLVRNFGVTFRKGYPLSPVAPRR